MPHFDFHTYKTETLSAANGDLCFRAWYGIPYADRPTAPDLQVLHIFIPEAYFHDGIINGYTVKTAPIFFPNAVGGYLEAYPCCPACCPDGRCNSEAAALAHGYVVISAGVRGANTQVDGRYVGKAPAAIVDLKAAVRFIRSIADEICGDTEKIIANGTSAGGALSALLAASGDSPLYEPYLQEIGAVKGSDRIYAASCYCPITNLEHADASYEWQYGHLTEQHMEHWEWERDHWTVTPAVYAIPEERMALSAHLRASFPEYLNRIAPHGLALDADGNGSFAEAVKQRILESAEAAAQAGAEIPLESGVSLTAGTVDFKQYCAFITRMKSPCAFDDPEMQTFENDLFGTETGGKRHFTQFGMQCSPDGEACAPAETVFLMNAMNFINHAGCATYWRIRHGAADRDTSFAIPVLLAECLRHADVGKSVDFCLPWGVPHCGDYDLTQLFAWVDGVVGTVTSV